MKKSLKSLHDTNRSYRRFSFESLESRNLLSVSPLTTPIISEIGADNDSVILDGDGNASDWIEIYNPTQYEVDLSNWHLTDKPNKVSEDTWAFPEGTTIEAGGYLLVFTGSDVTHYDSEGNETVYDSAGYIHADFGLSASGESVALFDDQLNLVYSVEFSTQLEDISYGVIQDVTTLVDTTSELKYYVPQSSSDYSTNWTDVNYDDSDWTEATGAIGFDTSTVTNFDITFYVSSSSSGGGQGGGQGGGGMGGGGMGGPGQQQTTSISTLTAAMNLINGGTATTSSANATVIDIYTSSSMYGNFSGTQYGLSGRNYAMLAQANIIIPEDGYYTFGVGCDQGCYLNIENSSGTSVLTIEQSGLSKFTTLVKTAYFSKGVYSLDLVTYDSNGSAAFELSAAKGEYSAFDSTAFHLVGDTANGGLALSAGADLYTTDVSADMCGVNSTILTRTEFNVTEEDLNNIENLYLNVKYNDGFVAYLNGTEIARQNAGGTLVWNSTADTELGLLSTIDLTPINITAFKSLLKEGTNVLAIQALNASANNTDFLLSTQIVASSMVTQTVTVDGEETTQPVTKYLYTATPGYANDSEYFDSICGNVTFSLEHGWYDTAQTVYLSTDEQDASIYYTTDGSVPSATNGTLYNASTGITIDSTTVLRAIAVKEGSKDSYLSSATYLFLSDIINQSSSTVPDGFPTSSVNSQSLDYAMDSSVLSKYTTEELQAAFDSIATFSMITDADNLFDSSTGIYVNAEESGRDWEREAALELIYPTSIRESWAEVEAGTKTRDEFIEELGDLYPDLQNMLAADTSDETIDAYLSGFTTECGIRIRGGSSRSSSNPKHSFRIFIRSEYGGEGSLDYPLYGTEDWNGVSSATSFDKFDLRTSQNYSWAYSMGGGGGGGMGGMGGSTTSDGASNTFVRDSLIRALQGILDEPSTKGRYYHLFIDGVYWGVYETEERGTAEFAESYLGGDEAEYDVLKCDSSTHVVSACDGNTDLYYQLWEANNTYFCPYNSNRVTDQDEVNAAYYKLQGLEADGVTTNSDYTILLDVENLCDYMILSYYFENLDGAGSIMTNTTNNFTAIINRENPQGFQFLLHDNEISMGLTNGHSSSSSSSGDILCTQTYFSYTSALSSLLQGITYFNPQYLHECLMASVPDYRIAFADRLYELTHNDGALTEENVKKYFLQIQGMMGTAMICESARWGDSTVSSAYTIDTWKTACNTAYNWLTGRVETVTSELQSLYIYKSGYTSTVSNLSSIKFYPSIEPASFNTGLTYQTDDESYVYPTSTNGAGVTVLLLSDSTEKLLDSSTITSGTTVYYTIDGSDPRTVCDGEVSSTASVYSAGTSESAILSAAQAADETELTLNVRSYNASTGTWSALNSATVYTADPMSEETVIPNVVINEVMTNPVTQYSHDYIELYNNESTAIDLSGWILIDSDIEDLANSTKTFWIPDGTSIAAGGILLFEEGTNFTFGLGKKGEAVYLLMPDSNGEYTDCNGEKYTLVDTIDVPKSADDAAYGRTTDGGTDWAFLDKPTPGTTNTPTDDDEEEEEEEKEETQVPNVVINEVMTNPSVTYSEHDYIELYNNESTSIDVGGWILIDSAISKLATTDKAYYIPEGTTIASGGFLLFEEITDFTFGIGKSGEAVYLLMPDENGSYTDSNGDKYTIVNSIEVPTSDADEAYGRTTDGGTDWAFLDKPTPGTTNTPTDEEEEQEESVSYHELSQNWKLCADSSGTWTAQFLSADAQSLNEWNNYKLNFGVTLDANSEMSVAIKPFTFKLTYYSHVFTPTVLSDENSDVTMSILEEESGTESGTSVLTISVDIDTAFVLTPGQSFNMGGIAFTPTTDQEHGLLINESLDNLGSVDQTTFTLVDSLATSTVTSQKATVNSTVSCVPYDLNDDGAVNSSDFILFATCYGSATTDSALSAITDQSTRKIYVAANFDKTGKIDSTDFILFAQNYGLKAGQGDSVVYPVETASTVQVACAAIVPEPTPVTLQSETVAIEEIELEDVQATVQSEETLTDELEETVAELAVEQVQQTATNQQVQAVEECINRPNLLKMSRTSQSLYQREPLWKRGRGEN